MKEESPGGHRLSRHTWKTDVKTATALCVWVFITGPPTHSVGGQTNYAPWRLSSSSVTLHGGPVELGRHLVQLVSLHTDFCREPIQSRKLQFFVFVVVTTIYYTSRLRRMHAVHRCDQLLLMLHVAWSVCLSVCVCWSHGCAVQKLLSRS